MSPSNDSRRPLWNALKYASSFPVIFLSAAQRLVVSDLVANKGDEVGEEVWRDEYKLFRLWYVFGLSPLHFRALPPHAWFVKYCQAPCRPRQLFVFLLVGRNE